MRLKKRMTDNYAQRIADLPFRSKHEKSLNEDLANRSAALTGRVQSGNTRLPFFLLCLLPEEVPKSGAPLQDLVAQLETEPWTGI